MMIFERIAAYEAAFRRCGTGLRMAKLLSYLSEPEVEVLKLMNLDHVTDPDRLEQIKSEEQGRQTFFGDEYAPYLGAFGLNRHWDGGSNICCLMRRRDVEPLAPAGLKGAWQPQRSG